MNKAKLIAVTNNEYNPDGYNRNSFAQIMQGIFAEQMIRLDRTGHDGFKRTHQEQMALKAKIQKAYAIGKDIPIHCYAEAVLFALRDGMMIQDVMKLSNKKLIQRAKKINLTTIPD